jgi:hypothetical protein
MGIHPDLMEAEVNYVADGRVSTKAGGLSCVLRHITGIATKRDDTPRVSGPAVVLDGNRFRNQTDRFQRLLQRASQSFGAEGENADRNN